MVRRYAHLTAEHLSRTRIAYALSGKLSNRSAAPTHVYGTAVKEKGLHHLQALDYSGAPGRIRTHDPLVRSQVLYPTELRARGREFNMRPLRALAIACCCALR